MHRRKSGKGKQQPAGDGKPAGEAAQAPPAKSTPAAGSADAAQGTPARKATAAKTTPVPAPGADRRPAQEAGVPAALHAAAAAMALMLLLFCHHAAVRLLAPQTGEWLASSFCSATLLAIATVAAVAGHVTTHAAALVESACSGSGTAAAWWAAAAAAGATAAVAPVKLAGSLLLAPGLETDSGRQITDVELTLRCMAVAAAALGPLFAALGCALGAGATHALHALRPGAKALPLLLLTMAAAVAVSMHHGLPAAVVPPWPDATVPPAVLAAAAAVAALSTPQPAAASTSRRSNGKASKGRGGGRSSSSSSSRRQAMIWACVAAVVAIVLLAVVVHQPCSTAVRQLEGGQYTVLSQCRMRAGGMLAVVEGTHAHKYRYRLLRLDHSVMGGEYVAPADVAGQPIYTTFYLQQAAALLRPNGTRSLHVGLGIGTTVKAMHRLGVTADVMELHPEVVEAARQQFGLRPELRGGRAMVGDALELLPQLARAAVQAGSPRYDYILHDVFSGGGTAAPLMDAPFFRQLSTMLAPGGVLAVNYYGGKGQGLKQAWCRLRLVFDSVRAFSDVEKSRIRNHVLFASHSDLAAVDLTEAFKRAEAAAAAAVQAAVAGGGGPEAAAAAEVLDPLQLRLWGSLAQQEVHLTYDRQRCQAMLRRHDGLPPRGGGGTGHLGGKQRQQQGQQAQQPLPWLARRLRDMKERHAVAVTHWVAMRKQFADSLWLS